MVRPQFSFTGAEHHLLFLAQESAGPEASSQPSITENAEAMQMPEEPTIELKDDHAASEEAQKAVQEEEEFIANKNKRMLDAQEKFQENSKPTTRAEVLEKTKRRDNCDRACQILAHLTYDFFEKVSHNHSKEILGNTIDDTAENIATRDASEQLTDLHSNDWQYLDPDPGDLVQKRYIRGGKSKSAYDMYQQDETQRQINIKAGERGSDIRKEHSSIDEYEAYSEKMEGYRAALSHIHVHPSHDAISFDEEAKKTLGLDDTDFMSIADWNRLHPDSAPLEENGNTGSPDAHGQYQKGNIVQEFIAKDPEILMKKIETKLESYKEGGKVLFTKEKLIIEDTQHDDIPQSVEDMLDGAQLQDNGEWKIENGAAALEFIRNYADPIEGDDFLEAEERSWRIPMQEYHRKEQDGANIEAEQRIQKFKTQVEANNADWGKIEPLLRECTAHREPGDDAATSRAYEQQREIFRLLYAKTASESSDTEQPEYAGMKRAYKMRDAINGIAKPPVSPLESPQFLQEWNEAFKENDQPKKELLQVQIDAFNQQFGEYTTKVETLRKTYPELPIPMNAGISSAIDTTPLLGIATSVLDRELAAFVEKQPDMKHAVNDIYIKRDTEKYNEQEFIEERDRPTRRGQLQDDIQKKEVSDDGTLTLNNKQMDQFRSLVQRRATQTARVYRKRVHEVEPSGKTTLDPARLATADASRILISYRNPVFTQRFKQWETDHMQRDPEVVQGRQERFQALDSLNTLRDEFRSHLLDSHNAKLPKNVEERLKAFEQLIAENNTLNLSTEELTPGVVTQRELTPQELTQFDERLKEAHSILNELNEENAPKGERHNAKKLEDTFDTITDDNFVTLDELEKDLKALPPDSDEAKTLRVLLEAGKKAKDSHTPTQVNGININITFNRHGEIGIHKSNAKSLLEKVHSDHLDIWFMNDVDMEALAQAQCPITVHEPSITPRQAQAFRSYNGPNAVLTLPDITELSPQTIQYLSKNHCKLVMTVTLLEKELSDESIIALRQINKVRENDITLVIPKEATISKKTLQRYESLGRYRIKVKNEGATVTEGSEAKDETVTDEKTATDGSPLVK